ncbi:MAG TPA: dihydrofolate reductase [Woeseiaceae bacterium]|nr:dihydrofolate reductase [Woeseiaceae bacterium]
MPGKGIRRTRCGPGVKLTIVVAASANDVIGRQGGLPWHLPEDLRRFRQLTWGKPLLMGRRTYEAIGRPLPGRRNIVISRQPGLEIDGCEVVATIDEALELVADAPEVMVVGGGEIYRALLPRVDRIEMTRVHMEVEGDTYFPELKAEEWRVVSRENHSGFAFETLERV